MRVLFMSLLLLGSACALKRIVTSSCDNTFTMFEDNPFMRLSMKSPAFTSNILDYMDNELGSLFKKACPAATAEQVRTMAFKFGDIPGLFLQMMDKTARTPYAAIKEAGCLNNGLEILESFGWFNVPDTCNHKTWAATGKCKFMIDFGSVLPGITFVANVAKCPGSNVPQFTVECEGPNCVDLFKPCSVDADCSGKCEQFVSNPTDRPLEQDVGKFFVQIMTEGHFLKEGSVDNAWGKGFANKALSSLSKLMQFKPYDAGKDFFSGDRLNIGICNFPFSDLDQIEKQCTKTENRTRYDDNSCGWICQNYTQQPPTYGYGHNAGVYANGQQPQVCSPWKTYTCPVPKERKPETMSCDFIKPYDKDLSMANPNSPSNAVSTGFDGLGFSFDCDSVMSLWMGKDRAISGQMSFLNKGFAEIADMVQKELTAKRNIPAGDALTKNFIPSSIEFWKQMATAAEAGKAPTEFDGYSMAELMYNEMMVSKCSAGPDYIQAMLAMKDRSDDFVCNNFQDIFDPDFVAKCGSQLVALNGSPFAKKCQLSTFDASQTQQVNFKGAKGLPSTCSLAGGNQCAFQWDLTKLMRGKQATARMWMKTCPSGLPSMYMDLIGPGTASLQNPVGDYCDTNAQTNQCPSNYMCVDMENTKFLAGMAYDRERKYVKCASDSECTPFSRTRDVWVGEGYEMKFDAKCDTTQGFCVWDSRGTNIDPHSRVVTQSVFEELFNGNKPVKDDSIYGLVQTIVGKTVSPPPAGKHGLCLGLDLNFEKWSEAALSMDSTTKAVTFGGMSPWDVQQAASTAAPTAKVYTGSPTEFGKTGAPTAKPPTVPPTEKAYTGSPTEFGKTGSPTTPRVQAPTKAEDETSGCSALHPGFVGLAATIVLAF